MTTLSELVANELAAGQSIFGYGVAAKYKEGRVDVNSGAKWDNDTITCSFKQSSLRIMSGVLPGTPPTTVAQATAYALVIQTGSVGVADAPPQGSGGVYCIKDSADATGTTWVTVLTSSIQYLQAQGRHFCSTGSDKNFILADWLAPWHVTASAGTTVNYQPRVYAVWKSAGSSLAVDADTITEISAANKVGWTFYPDAGVLKINNPTQTFTFTGGQKTWEENLATLATNYTSAGYQVLSRTQTTTEDSITLGGAWASGSLATPTWRPLTDIITAATGALTSSCFRVDGYRFIGRSIYLG